MLSCKTPKEFTRTIYTSNPGDFGMAPQPFAHGIHLGMSAGNISLQEIAATVLIATACDDFPPFDKNTTMPLGTKIRSRRYRGCNAYVVLHGFTKE